MASVLLFDAGCGFCTRTVRWMLQRERQPTLYLAGLRSAFARELLRHHPAWSSGDTVLWVDVGENREPVRILGRSAAVLRVLQYLGGAWHLLRIAWIVPRPLRDAVYDLVARNRHHLRGDRPGSLPALTRSARFVDDLPLDAFPPRV